MDKDHESVMKCYLTLYIQFIISFIWNSEGLSWASEDHITAYLIFFLRKNILLPNTPKAYISPLWLYF